jgi:hypothetical protein
MSNNCTICGEPMEEGVPFKFHGYDGNDCPKPPVHKDLVVVESGIRQRRDGTIVFFVGGSEVECASMREAEAMLADLNAMVKRSGGSTHPSRAN